MTQPETRPPGGWKASKAHSRVKMLAIFPPHYNLEKKYLYSLDWRSSKSKYRDDKLGHQRLINYMMKHKLPFAEIYCNRTGNKLEEYRDCKMIQPENWKKTGNLITP